MPTKKQLYCWTVDTYWSSAIPPSYSLQVTALGNHRVRVHGHVGRSLLPSGEVAQKVYDFEYSPLDPVPTRIKVEIQGDIDRVEVVALPLFNHPSDLRDFLLGGKADGEHDHTVKGYGRSSSTRHAHTPYVERPERVSGLRLPGDRPRRLKKFIPGKFK